MVFKDNKNIHKSLTSYYFIRRWNSLIYIYQVYKYQYIL